MDRELLNTAAPMVDLLQGDMSIYNACLKDLDMGKIKAALDFILNNQKLSDSQKAGLITNSWRIYYREKPPTPEEFLTEKYLGRMAPSIYPRVRQWFLGFFNGDERYRDAILYVFIGGGKSTLAVLINLYITTHLALMRDPKKYLGQAPSAILTFALCSFNLKKASETLLEPFINILEVSEYFQKVRAMTLDTRLYGEKGIILNKDIKVGDKIYDDSGILTTVLKVSPQGKTRVMRVTFVDGRYVDTNPEHLWKAYKYTNKDGPRWKIITTEDMANESKYTWKVPLPKPTCFEGKDHILSPYILGMWLGDGCFSNYNITFASDEEDAKETIGRVIQELPKQLTISHSTTSKNPWAYQVVRSGYQKELKTYDNPFLSELRRLDLVDKKADSKFIPEEYIYDSIENRIALLQGLMDSDGTSDKHGTHTSFGSISKALSEGVAYLVRSLGGIARVRVYNDKRVKKGLKYRVNITFPDSSIIPFYLKRKVDNFLLRYKDTHRSVKNYGIAIHSIEEINQQETQCIMAVSYTHLTLPTILLV